MPWSIHQSRLGSAVNSTDFAIAPSTTIALKVRTTFFNRSFLFSLEGTLAFFVRKYNMVDGRQPI
jgi:hypothetical protein